MTPEQINNLLMTMAAKPEEELNAMVDTGMFNSVIEGYLIATLRSMDCSNPDIQEAVRALHRIFDDMDAAEARKEIV